MDFAAALERLTVAANCGTRGVPVDKAIVSRADLQELLYAFHDADHMIRHAYESPRI